MKNLENVLLKDNIICDWCEKKGSGGSAVVKTRDGIVAQATLCHDCLLNDAEIED